MNLKSQEKVRCIAKKMSRIRGEREKDTEKTAIVSGVGYCGFMGYTFGTAGFKNEEKD